jgi:hypothetical protein
MRFGHSVTPRKRTSTIAKAAPDEAGDIGTWTAIDADSKPIVSYAVVAGMPATRKSS